MINLDKITVTFDRAELWELMNGFGQSFESGLEGNELADRVSQKLSNAYKKLQRKSESEARR